MAIVKMKKVTMIALQSEKNEIVNRLQKFGKLQVLNLEEQFGEEGFEELQADSDNEAVGRLEAKLSQVKFSLDFLNKYSTAKKGLFAPKAEVDDAKRVEYLENEEKLNEIYESCRSIDGKFTELKSVDTKLHNTIAQLTPWLPLDMKIEDIGNTQNTATIIGFIPTKYVDQFNTSVQNENLEAYVEKISEEKENSYMLAVYHRVCEENMLQLLKQYGWTKVTFSEFTGTPKENVSKLDESVNELGNKRAELTKQAESLVSEISFLEVLYDLISIEKDKRSVVKDFGKTEKTFMLHGWIPEKAEAEMVRIMDSITERYTVQFEEPGDEDDIPVLLENSKIVQPFEMITSLYSLPNARSIDSNAIMTPFFIVFFGIMITDAAYGAIMAAVTGFILWKFKLVGGIKKFMGIMFFGGLSALVWGGVFGGWFGNLVPISAFWFNPLQEPLKMLIFCLALGVIHLYTGYFIQAYKNIKAGHIMDAVYDQVLWLMLLTGLMFLALPALATVGKYMAIVGAAGTVLFNARSEKNFIKRILNGILALYGVSGFLGDVLSYSRLFALCLSTGVIAMVFNAMGIMMGGTLIGKLIMVIFLVVGHLFNIALGILGAYVHTSRLQYVEFFGKFYEGEGKAFNPLKVKTKYIQE